MTKLNPLFLNDVYKHGHADFYNPKTTKIYSTFTPRKSRVNGEKKSQKGLVLVCKDNDDNIVYLDELTQEFKQRLHNMDLLKTLFIDGKLVRETSLAEIRNRLTQV